MQKLSLEFACPFNISRLQCGWLCVARWITKNLPLTCACPCSLAGFMRCQSGCFGRTRFFVEICSNTCCALPAVLAAFAPCACRSGFAVRKHVAARQHLCVRASVCRAHACGMRMHACNHAGTTVDACMLCMLHTRTQPCGHHGGCMHACLHVRDPCVHWCMHSGRFGSAFSKTGSFSAQLPSTAPLPHNIIVHFSAICGPWPGLP